ncbi:hypothetical protein [Actinomyces sp. ZJ308]|uniref:hypothetical protein n=1 Tax=Actinomyces sp. ZJ308 TaxID=2708342 RepID=UPI001FBB5684|nr:hypothetical protein [Actinomyces sp. ZJ308]
MGRPVPWRGEKTAALIMILTSCVLQVAVFIIFQLSMGSATTWVNLVIRSVLYFAIMPTVWWLYFTLRRFFRNQPVSEMTGLSLWFLLGTLSLLTEESSDPYSGALNVTTVLSFITTTIGAVLTARLNQRLPKPQPWAATLTLGACQFVLINSVQRFGHLSLAAISQGRSITQYTAGVWFTWSNSGGVGVPLAPGLLIFSAITSLAAAALFMGIRSPSGRAFRTTSLIAAVSLILYNLLVILIYGLPTRGEYWYTPSETGLEVTLILVFGAVLIGSILVAGRRLATPLPANGGPHHPHAGYAPSTRGTQSRFRQHHQPQSPPGGRY